MRRGSSTSDDSKVTYNIAKSSTSNDTKHETGAPVKADDVAQELLRDKDVEPTCQMI